MPETEAGPRVRTTETTTLVPTAGTPYRTLHEGGGESHGRRTDLVGDHPASEAPRGSNRIAGLIHFTDFQLADLASPSRVEYLQRFTGVPTWERMLPAYRPQEFLLPHAMEQIVRSINAFAETAPGQWDLTLTTGDNTDTAQANELNTFLTFLGGGALDPAEGTNGFADAPVGFGDENYYNPEPTVHDRWKSERGLPSHPGALAAAAQPFEAAGLATPWLSCFGNHDCLVQGRAAAPEGYDDFLTGSSKPVQFPDPSSGPAGDKLDAYVADPRWVSAGPEHGIGASQHRRMVSKEEYMAAHLETSGLPQGHGFAPENVASGRAYYVYDAIPGVRLIVLDTTNVAGHVDGCVDEEQFAWLQERLIEVHTSYHGEDGERRAGGGEDRFVILASHHGLSTMTNNFGEYGAGGRLHLADDIEAMLHRYPNVGLWLSGHTHVNKITARPGTDDPEGGFWEVSTGSIAEWPVQFRAVEISADSQAVTIRTTMVDSQAPAAPGPSLGLADLASLHREIGANDDGSVGGLFAEGTARDRNQDLVAPVSRELLQVLARS